MKRVLLAVVGLSPQVVTETLYALLQQGRMVDELQILTTRPGREVCLATLLCPAEGRVRQLLSDHGLAESCLKFDAMSVEAVCGDGGAPLNDIQTEEDSAAFLQACMRKVFHLTSSTSTAVYFSIAGGRKTMGAALALAAQCYGRAQDRLFHVLVSSEFEGCRDFFYPPPESRPLVLHDDRGEPYAKESRYARVQLVALPFVSFRERLGADMLGHPESPEALMLSMVREEAKQLVVDIERGVVSYGGREADMPPTQIALYGYFAQRRKDARNEPLAEASQVFAEQERIATLYRVASRRAPTTAPLSETGILNLNQENFNAYKAKINQCLARAFGAYEAPSLQIASHGRAPVRYMIDFPPDKIRIIR